VLKQMTQMKNRMKNRISGLLMETGVSYNKQRLHKLGYFLELMSCNEEVNGSIRPLLKLSREVGDHFSCYGEGRPILFPRCRSRS
jgi:hypothetical protein